MAVRPAWAIDPIRRFQALSLEINQIWLLTIQALSRLDHQVKSKIFKVELRSLGGSQDAAAFAADEVSNGYPRVSAHALIGIWGAFEIMLDDLRVAFLVNDGVTLHSHPFSKTKIALAEFENLDKEERMRYLLSEFEKVNGMSRLFGVDRFERMLEPFGLNGAVDKDVVTNVREMHSVRNIVVHKASIADRRIVEECPWMKLKLGQRIMVNDKMLLRFYGSLTSYCVVIADRIELKFAQPPASPQLSA